jgi:hypothetical protein
MALIASSLPALGTSASFWPVAGLYVANVSPDWASTKLPLMKSL